jgi:hypothetical protein
MLASWRYGGGSVRSVTWGKQLHMDITADVTSSDSMNYHFICICLKGTSITITVKSHVSVPEMSD